MEKNMGIGLGNLGVDINLTLRLGEIKNTVDMLTDAIQQTGETATNVIADAVQKLRDAGVGDLQKSLGQGEGREERQNVYNKLVSSLRDAASKGYETAKSLLNELGESVETGGRKIQEVASKGSEESIH